MYGYIEEETMVLDVSYTLATPIKNFGFKAGISFVVDFEGGNLEIYPHGGVGTGFGTGVTYSVGKIENYNGSGSYSGPFIGTGGNVPYIGIGYDHSFDPRYPWNKTVKTNSLTFTIGGAYYHGVDYYLEPWWSYNWRNK